MSRILMIWLEFQYKSYFVNMHMCANIYGSMQNSFWLIEKLRNSKILL